MSERLEYSKPKLFQISCPDGTDLTARTILGDIGIIVEPVTMEITRVIGENGNKQILKEKGIFVTCYPHQEAMIRSVIERRAGWIPEVSEIKDEYFDS